MPVINRVSALKDEITEWRRDIHAHPEILYEVHRTAALVKDKLIEFGCDEVVPGIGRTGVVGVIRGKTNKSGRVIGMRADMDALPMQELTGLPYASKIPGAMHACGHDGHTAMLLGAAKYLAETRNFDGTAVVIFQPAEEGGAGGKAMVDDGMMDRFGVSEVYGMHTAPGLPVGHFATRAGPLLAASDRIEFEIEGVGTHAAKPHLGIDPVAIGCQLHQALQTIVARNVDPVQSAVVSVTMFHAGDAMNVIPQTAKLQGTVRTLKLTYSDGYPVTVNHEAQTHFAAKVAREISGDGAVNDNTLPVLGGEDFAYMLEARPGAFVFIGNGNTAGVHHPAYDFNDDAIPVGVSYWARLVETAMPA
jgi:amidohydrolase